MAFVLHVDALSVLFAFMGACIGGLVLLYSIGYMAHDKSATRFYAIMLVFIGGFIALVYSANLFIFYLCWELVGLCSFTLVGFWYTNREAVNGARKVLLMTHIAGYGLLAAILILYHRAGSALWTDPNVTSHFTGGIFALMLVALVAKSVQVPLHTWIPEAMAAPTPVSALLHSACYVTSGVYLAARMHSFGVWPAAWGESLMWIGTVTMAVGVMYAMVQSRPEAHAGVFNREPDRLHDDGPRHRHAARDHRRAAALPESRLLQRWAVFDGGQCAARRRHARHEPAWRPGAEDAADNFVLADRRGQHDGHSADERLCQQVDALRRGTAGRMGCARDGGMGGKPRHGVSWRKGDQRGVSWTTTEHTKDAHESPPTMVWGMGFLAAGSVVLGIAPQLAVNYFLNPILLALGIGAGVHVTWLGLSADAGSFSSTGGLVLAIVSLVIGGAIYVVAYAARPVAASGAAMAGAGGGIFTGGEPLSDQGRLTAGDFSEIFQAHWGSFFRWSNVDRVYLWFWGGLQQVSQGLGQVFASMERRAAVLVVAVAAAAFVLARWIVPGVAVSSPAALLPSEQIPLLLILAVAIAASALLIASLANSAGRKLIPEILLAGALTADGLLVVSPWWRLGLLELAALLTIVLVWRTARSQAAKLTYLAVVLISTGSMITSELMAERGALDWSRALLFTSVCVKLAAIPLLFWLLKLADELPALVLGVIIAVVDMAAFGEFCVAAQASPFVLTPQALWVWVAVGTSLVASLLMLTQRSLKRLLVLSTAEDVGFLLLGAASMSVIGIQGALVAAATHAMAKALLFICLAGPEAAGELEPNSELGPIALASRYPMSAFGFLFGMLAMLGVPPTLGFIGRWRLYSTALAIGVWPLVLLILSSIFALIAYALALSRNWWGPPTVACAGEDAGVTKTGFTKVHEPFAIKAAIVVLAVILVAAGVWPHAWQMLMGVRP